MKSLELSLGVKTDPIENRYSFDWLFRILADTEVRKVQLGTFFELYQLPDFFFHDLRKRASDCDVTITSVFTSHRELGGFFRREPGFAETARKSYRRLIKIAAALGAKSAGSNPGAALRDRMDDKAAGVARYLENMKELAREAADAGIEWLTIEPMSCLAEPPCAPDEIRGMMDALDAYRLQTPGAARIGLCADTSHGYADTDCVIRWDHMELLGVCLPYLYELHLKNTDCHFNDTFGFSEAERGKGVVDIPAVRRLLLENADRMPVTELTGFLEIGGPKTGRDYSDKDLERQIRGSLEYLKESFIKDPVESGARTETPPSAVFMPKEREPVLTSPSIMCCDCRNIERSVRELEAAGADMLHVDIMDGRFTPNMPIGLELVRQVKAITKLPFDIHLMVEDNEFFVEKCLEIGAERITIHAESCPHLDRALTRIREGGALAGAALNPSTPLSVLEFVLERLDLILLMTVNPGFAGQRLVPSAIRKIAACRSWLQSNGAFLPIEVDGNVSFDNIPAMVAAGADILVSGTSGLFHKDGSLLENARRSRRAALEGLSRRPTQTKAA